MRFDHSWNYAGFHRFSSNVSSAIFQKTFPIKIDYYEGFFPNIGTLSFWWRLSLHYLLWHGNVFAMYNVQNIDLFVVMLSNNHYSLPVVTNHHRSLCCCLLQRFGLILPLSFIGEPFCIVFGMTKFWNWFDLDWIDLIYKLNPLFGMII